MPLGIDRLPFLQSCRYDIRNASAHNGPQKKTGGGNQRTDSNDQIPVGSIGFGHGRELRNLRPADPAQAAVGAELAGRHAESLSELLPKVVLRIESAAPRDLRHAHVARFQQTRRLLEAFLFQKMAEQPTGDAMKASGDILPCVAELLGHCFNSDFLVLADPSANTLDERAKKAIHTARRFVSSAILS